MYRSMSQSKTKYQTTWSILIFSVILDDFTIGYYFAEFLDTDMADKALINSMFGEFKLFQSDFLTNFFNHSCGR